MQSLQDKLTQWAIKGIPFPREKLSRTLTDLQRKQKEDLSELLDIRPSSKDKSSLKGWGSSKLVSNFIQSYKQHWLPYLDITPKTRKIKFDSDAKERLLENFPDDRVLQLAYDTKKRVRAIRKTI